MNKIKVRCNMTNKLGQYAFNPKLVELRRTFFQVIHANTSSKDAKYKEIAN